MLLIKASGRGSSGHVETGQNMTAEIRTVCMFACVCVHFELNAGSATIQTKTQTWRRQWVGKAFCLFNLTSVCVGETARQREQCKKEVRLNGSCDCSSCVIDNETQTESINSNACQTQLCLHTAVKQYIGPKPAAQLRSSLSHAEQ